MAPVGKSGIKKIFTETDTRDSFVASLVPTWLKTVNRRGFKYLKGVDPLRNTVKNPKSWGTIHNSEASCLFAVRGPNKTRHSQRNLCQNRS